MADFRWTMLTLAAVLALCVGCESSEEQPPEEAAATQPTETQPSDRQPTTAQATTQQASGTFSFDREQFEADLAELTAGDHRLAGFEDGSRLAARYVQKRLEEMGIERVFTQEFPVIQNVPTEARLVADGREYPMRACRPNLLQAAITPEEGLSGRTLYAGNGNLEEYGGEIPQGRIVVLEWDSDMRWQHAFAFGAQAVVFIGSDSPAANAWHHLQIPANLPRFYVSPEVADELNLRGETREITLYAASQWRRLSGRNVIAYLPGTNPRYNTNRPPQAIVLAAPLDSYSEVPTLSPSARGAANCAALLQLADYLRVNRPRRDVVLAFFDAQSQAHAGARAFYGAIGGGQKRSEAIEDRLENIDAERNYCRRLLEIFSSEDLFAAETKELEYYDEALRELQNEVLNNDSDVLEKLRPLRLERSCLRRAEKPVPEEMEQRIEHLAAEDLAWNKLQGYIAKHQKLGMTEPQLAEHAAEQVREYDRQLGEEDEDSARARDMRIQRAIYTGLMEKMGIAKRQMRHLMRRRLRELDVMEARIRKGLEIRELLGFENRETVLHVSINLSDSSSRWTFIHGDDSGPMMDDKPGNYRGLFSTMEEVAESLGEEADRFDRRPISPQYSSRLFAPGLFVDSGAAARMFAIFNVAAMTSMDRLPREGQPCDTLASLDTEAFFPQVRELGRFLRVLADDERLNVTPDTRPRAVWHEAQWDLPQPSGGMVRRAGAGSAMPDRPVRDAIVAIMTRATGQEWDGYSVRTAPPGFVRPILVSSNINGVFSVGPYVPAPGTGQDKPKPMLFGAAFAAPTATTTNADTAQGPEDRGLIAYAGTQGSFIPTEENLTKIAVDLLHTRATTAVGFGFHRGAITTTAMRASSTAEFSDDRHLLCEWENVVTLFAPNDVEGYKLFNKAGMVLLNNEPTKQGHRGQGLPLEDRWDHPVTPAWTAGDLARLNAYRLSLLRDNRINEESLELLHSRAMDLAQDARRYRGGDAPSQPPGEAEESIEFPEPSAQKYFCDLSASAAYSHALYPPLVGVIKDLVNAVVLLLLLAMPFAYAMERLLIGTPHIYRQIGWFTLFFIVTFAILYLVNPAFSIAATPVVIFLAFAIILLSSLVIFIMVRKLQNELKKLQGLSVSVHSADVSRLSTMLAAVHMGISTMRRRPLRTLLTASTIVLLTFTILAFASFGTSWGLRETYEGPLTDPPPRILIRSQLWSPVGDGIYETLRGHFVGDAQVVPRYWLSPTAGEVDRAMAENRDLQKLLATGDGSRATPVAAGIGLDARDIRLQPELAKMLEGQLERLEDDGIFLTHAVADELKLDENDIGQSKVLLAGREFTFAGFILNALSGFTMIEDSSMLPVDYQTSSGGALESLQETGTESRGEMPDIESAQFVTYNLDRVVVIPPHVAEQMGAEVRSVTIYPDNVADLRNISEDAANISKLPTYVGDSGGVYRLIFTSLATASGWRDLLIPVVLGGLIVFATMLGSVSDREREIYTFSSLGLAPPHVASLFFAEASVYAVVGGMGGYLLGQLVTRAMAFLAELGYVAEPSMNYSSTNAIVTILIVMGTVLISTIYPAVKASRSANPGIQRHWRIPAPKGDLYDLVFPFTVSAYDITGVVSFLKEHFENHADEALGGFATTSCRIFRQEGNDLLGFGATVALAPFDLGVNEDFVLLSRPSEIEGIDEVRILIYRRSGAHGDWRRANRVFINDLRKQLLIWRSLPEDVIESYRQKTMRAWDQLPRERIDAESFGLRSDAPEGANA
ncbi:MAG: FtsX-like permease family protein [Phycisphaerae bacterium]